MLFMQYTIQPNVVRRYRAMVVVNIRQQHPWRQRMDYSDLCVDLVNKIKASFLTGADLALVLSYWDDMTLHRVVQPTTVESS